MIGKDHPSLSVGAQCRLLSIARSSFYYELMGETVMNLDLMVKIDNQFLEIQFFGVQQMTWHLQNEGHVMNYKRVRRLTRLMHLMPSTKSPIPAGLPRATRPTPICWAVCGWSDPLRSGAPTSPTYRCAVDSSNSSPSWIVAPARSWPGGYRTRWRPTSTLKR